MAGQKTTCLSYFHILSYDNRTHRESRKGINMTWIITHQLNWMLFMSGICSILAFSTLIIKSLPSDKRKILALMEFSTMVLLIFDRYSYLYRGNLTEFGLVMIRISNGLVYFLQLFLPFLVTQYLKNLFRDEGKMPQPPRILKICDWLFAAGTVLIIISQFTGLYYTIDAQNYYQRSSTHILCFLMPVLIVLLQEASIIIYRNCLNKDFARSLVICIALPTFASLLQIFFYGISIISLSTGLMVIVFYIYTLLSLSRSVENARLLKITVLKESRDKEAAMFRQTVEALANAIDAKDPYTHGHSTRVAFYSRQIAEKTGYSQEFCEEVYFSALLHDIGKIGIPDAVLNKAGKITDEEMEQIKMHPRLGSQILSSIKLDPNLSIGALYHHERYDGLGYPEGLAGEDIPVAARIIAVADAYDAMTSARSYRNSLSAYKVKEELMTGMGTQFDPVFAKALLQIIYGSYE